MQCRNCGNEFVSQAFNLTNSLRMTFENVGETCPRCGATATAMEGTFNLRGGSTEVVSAPQWSRDLVFRMNAQQAHRLRQTVNWAQDRIERGDPKPERTARALERSLQENVPQGKSFLSWLRGKVLSQESGVIAAWVGSLASVGALLLALNGQPNMSSGDVQQIIDEAVQASREERAAAERAGTIEPGRLILPPLRHPRVTELPTPKTH